MKSLTNKIFIYLLLQFVCFSALNSSDLSQIKGENSQKEKTINESNSNSFLKVPNEIYLGTSGIVTTNFPLLVSYLSVVDQFGNPLVNLSKSNFSITENGINCEIKSFGIDTNSVDCPISYGLVLDRSGSMEGLPLTNLKTATKNFITGMKTVDMAAIVSFSDSAKLNQSLTGDKNILRTAVETIVAGGWTSLYDGIVLSLNQIKNQTDRKVIIAVADGENNVGKSSKEEVISLAKQYGIPIYTIGIRSPYQDTTKLLQISDETGGMSFVINNTGQLEQIYHLILNHLNKQYKITFLTPNAQFDSTLRNVSFTVTYNSMVKVKPQSYWSISKIPLAPSAKLLSSDCTLGQYSIALNFSNGNNQPISELTKDNIKININGNKTNIDSLQSIFGCGQAPVYSDVLAISLVLDRSGSMVGQPIADLKSASKSFINLLDSQDRVAIVSFEAVVSLDQGLTNDKILLNNAINGLNAYGNTAMYDGAELGINTIKNETIKKIIIMITDGGDNSSHITKESIISMAQSSNITFFTIGIGNGVVSLPLIEIAQRTGGRYYFAPSSSDLTELYSKINQQIKSQYKVFYHYQGKHNAKVDLSYVGINLSSPEFVVCQGNAVDENGSNSNIKVYSLSQNYPNPFNPSTIISYQLPVISKVTLKIYNILGKEVETLINREQESGIYSIEWNASKYSSGVYYYELIAGQYKEIRKMILTK